MMGSDMIGSSMMQMMMGTGAGAQAHRCPDVRVECLRRDGPNQSAAILDMHWSMMSQHASGTTLPERLGAEDKALRAHSAAFKKTTASTALLSPEQKKIANGTLQLVHCWRLHSERFAGGSRLRATLYNRLAAALSGGGRLAAATSPSLAGNIQIMPLVMQSPMRNMRLKRDRQQSASCAAGRWRTSWHP